MGDVNVMKEDGVSSDNESIEKKEFIIHTTGSPGFFSDANLGMTEVLPNLLMGGVDPALDSELLKDKKVRHVLSLGLLNVPNFEGINYHHMRLLDLPRFNLLPHLEAAISVIENARKVDETIYVHCQAGVSRSSTVVIAYLMKRNSWAYKQAYDFLKDLRPCIEPNSGFVKQLLKFESLIINN